MHEVDDQRKDSEGNNSRKSGILTFLKLQNCVERFLVLFCFVSFSFILFRFM